MADYPIFYNKSEYLCKLCNKPLSHSNMFDYINNCDNDNCNNYSFIYQKSFSSGKIYEKLESYYYKEICIDINYLDKSIVFDLECINIVNFNDYKLDDIEQTFSIATIETILNKFLIYRNII